MKTRKAFFSNPRENAMANPRNSDTQLISAIEPFLDMDMKAIRSGLIDDSVIAQHQLMLAEQLGQAEGPDFIFRLTRVLAEIKADMHYLKAAYVESARYRDPDFNIKTPTLPKKIKPDVLEVDMRGEITGGNWHQAEPDGRWAGPESDSSILVPALHAGTYDIEINIVGEMEPGIIEGMVVTLNRREIVMDREGHAIPAVLKSRAVIEESYRFPFWTVKFFFPKLVSPSVHGSDDQRVLAIRVKNIRFSKVEV